MALIWMDGLDNYSDGSQLLLEGVWTDTGGGFRTNIGRFGLGGIGTGYNNPANFNISANPREFWVGGAVYLRSAASTFFTFSSEYSIHNQYNKYEFAVVYNPGTAHLYAQRMYSGIIAETYNTIQLNTWHWVEAYVSLGTYGAFQLWIDGVKLLDANDTNPLEWPEATGISNITLGTNYWTYDDLYLLDTTGPAPLNNRLGDSKIYTFLPNRDAASNDGTPLSGTDHYAMVNENGMDLDSSYVTLSQTPGSKEMYGTNASLTSNQSVYCIKTSTAIQKSDAGTTFSNIQVRSNGVYANTVAFPPTTSWSVNSVYSPTDPNTGQQWTYANANAINVGLGIDS